MSWSPVLGKKKKKGIAFMSLLVFYFLIAVSEKIPIRTWITERLSGTVQFQNLSGMEACCYVQCFRVQTDLLFCPHLIWVQWLIPMPVPRITMLIFLSGSSSLETDGETRKQVILLCEIPRSQDRTKEVLLQRHPLNSSPLQQK